MSAVAIKLFFALLLVAVIVGSVEIKKPESLRYEPCALGIVQFDRINELSWKAVVNIGLYDKLDNDDLTIDITFKDPVQIRIDGVLYNSILNNRRYIFEIQAPAPAKLFFSVRSEANHTDVPTVTKYAFNNDILCDNVIRASQTVESLTVRDDSEYHGQVCGRKPLPNAELTRTNSEVQPGDWPWTVTVFKENNKYYCGGSIISRTAVLTTGLCVSAAPNLVDILPAEQVVVVAGTNNYKNDTQPGRQRLTADEVVRHPDYVSGKAAANLAVIRVSGFRYTEYVQPVCIWGPEHDKTNLFGYEATLLSLDHNRQGEAAGALIENDSTCIDHNDKSYREEINEFTFCASFGPNSSTSSTFRNLSSGLYPGSGLVIPKLQSDNKISWFLRGIFFNYNPSYPIYVDVGRYYRWIMENSGLVLIHHGDLSRGSEI